VCGLRVRNGGISFARKIIEVYGSGHLLIYSQINPINITRVLLTDPFSFSRSSVLLIFITPLYETVGLKTFLKHRGTVS